MRIYSWNVNGIRAAQKKGFLKWLETEKPDILCVQETKAMPEQLDEDLLNPPGYTVHWNSAQRKGYSGVATFCKKGFEAKSVGKGFGIDRFDEEGRVLVTEHEDFLLYNIYFPNGQRDDVRLKYKLDFYDDALVIFNKLRKKGKKLLICGDYNTAHKEIDLARPKENEDVSGFLPIERAWMDQFVGEGFVDTFRLKCKDPNWYSWWSMRSAARERNVGWRIDYHFVTENLADRVKKAHIQMDVMGSDHCPVVVELK